MFDLCDLLLDLGHLGAAVLHLRLDLGTELDRELTCFDLRFPADRLGLALCDVNAGAGPEQQQRRSETDSDSESDERRNRSEHAVLPLGRVG